MFLHHAAGYKPDGGVEEYGALPPAPLLQQLASRHLPVACFRDVQAHGQLRLQQRSALRTMTLRSPLPAPTLACPVRC